MWGSNCYHLQLSRSKQTVSVFSLSSLTMGQLYEKEKDEDGFLYVAYSGENTFGFWMVGLDYYTILLCIL